MKRSDIELKLLTSLTRRLPRVRGAGVIGTRLAAFYTRKRRPVVTSEVCGLKMRLDPHELVDSALLFMPRLYDYREIGFLEKHIRKGDTFIDIGANVGFYSLIASSLVGDAGRVISIEAVPDTFEILKKNIDMNGIGNIVPVNLGVSSQPETIEMKVVDKSGLHRNSGGNSFLTDADGPRVSIACRPLDEILTEHEVCGRYALKLDVEGFEYRILKTFVENGGRSLPFCIIVEQNPGRLEGDSVGLLKAQGYRLVFETRRHNYVMSLDE